MSEWAIRNARIVAGEELMRGSVLVRDGRIAAVDSGAGLAGEDFGGDFLLPGLVELHTDNLERHLMPRPKVHWPSLPALLAHDAEVVAAGITTVYDAIGVGDPEPESLRAQDLLPVRSALEQAERAGLLRAEHRLHVRVELPAPNARTLFEALHDDRRIGLVSLMDHTPGQRQWEDIEQARLYYCGKKGWSEAQFARMLEQGRAQQARYAQSHRRYFVAYARARAIPLASHDDTRPEHVAEAHADGACISEFPTHLAAAREARTRGMTIVAGAPNVVRGGSHSGNVAATELARVGLVDALSSDYVPASLLLAAFALVRESGFHLPQAVATVTRAPARAVGLADRGAIAPGLRADLVRVRTAGDLPLVCAVWREGRRIA